MSIPDAKLEPCPYCGMDNKLAIGGGDMYQVICKWCGTRGPLQTNDGLAKDAWNDMPRGMER